MACWCLLDARCDIIIVCSISLIEASFFWAQDLACLLGIGDVRAALFRHIPVNSIFSGCWRLMLDLTTTVHMSFILEILMFLNHI